METFSRRLALLILKSSPEHQYDIPLYSATNSGVATVGGFVGYFVTLSWRSIAGFISYLGNFPWKCTSCWAYPSTTTLIQ